MQLTEEDFNEKFKQALDAIALAMAESEEVDPDKFFSMVCILENLQFFSPVVFGALKKPLAE